MHHYREMIREIKVLGFVMIIYDKLIRKSKPSKPKTSKPLCGEGEEVPLLLP